MKKIILCMMAAVAATLMLTGCGAGEFEDPVPTVTEATAETAPAVQDLGTMPTEGAVEERYECGDPVWYVLHYEPGFRAQCCEAVVLEEAGDHVRVNPICCAEGLCSGEDYTEWMIPRNDCYRTQEDARAVVMAENADYDDSCG